MVLLFLCCLVLAGVQIFQYKLVNIVVLWRMFLVMNIVHHLVTNNSWAFQVGTFSTGELQSRGRFRIEYSIGT